MIAKRVHRQKSEDGEIKPDNYKALALYIAHANEKDGEKTDHFWMVNCEAGEGLEDLDLAVLEIKATQNLNTRSKGDKTYHLIFSFREGEKPPLEALQEMEREFAKALGFEDHQRVVGSHQDTGNYHVHVAYNIIHPETLKSHQPGFDYYRLEDVCRAMEQKYGLQVDNGIEKTRGVSQEADKLTAKAKGLEAQTWEESFERYVKGYREEILEIRNTAASWEDLHTRLSGYDLVIKKRGNGLVFNTLDDRATLKASELHRNFSKPALEKTFGAFEEPPAGLLKGMQEKAPEDRPASYEERPLTRYPGQEALWEKYQQARRASAAPNRRGSGTHTQQNKRSLAYKIWRNWKTFLQAEALSDPMAMAIILYHQKLLKMPEQMFGINKQGHPFKHRYTQRLKGTQSAEEKRARLETEIARQAFTLWRGLGPWASQKNAEWLKDRKINSYGLKLNALGEPVVPLRDEQGRLHSLVTLTENGAVYMPGGKRLGLYHVIDPALLLRPEERQAHAAAKNARAMTKDSAPSLSDKGSETLKPEMSSGTLEPEAGPETLFVAVGYETAAALYEATGRPVFVALEEDNLREIAALARKQHPELEIMIVQDMPASLTVTADLAVPESETGTAIPIPEASGSDPGQQNDTQRVTGPTPDEPAPKEVNAETPIPPQASNKAEPLIVPPPLTLEQIEQQAASLQQAQEIAEQIGGLVLSPALSEGLKKQKVQNWHQLSLDQGKGTFVRTVATEISLAYSKADRLVSSRWWDKAPDAAERVWLDVPYKDGQEARKHGAKWDARERSWYIKQQQFTEELRPYIPTEPEEAPYIEMDKDLALSLGGIEERAHSAKEIIDSHYGLDNKGRPLAGIAEPLEHDGSYQEFDQDTALEMGAFEEHTITVQDIIQCADPTETELQVSENASSEEKIKSREKVNTEQAYLKKNPDHQKNTDLER